MHIDTVTSEIFEDHERSMKITHSQQRATVSLTVFRKLLFVVILFVYCKVEIFKKQVITLLEGTIIQELLNQRRSYLSKTISNEF